MSNELGGIFQSAQPIPTISSHRNWEQQHNKTVHSTRVSIRDFQSRPFSCFSREFKTQIDIFVYIDCFTAAVGIHSVKFQYAGSNPLVIDDFKHFAAGRDKCNLSTKTANGHKSRPTLQCWFNSLFETVISPPQLHLELIIHLLNPWIMKSAWNGIEKYEQILSQSPKFIRIWILSHSVSVVYIIICPFVFWTVTILHEHYRDVT